jgi:hypothetical protein
MHVSRRGVSAAGKVGMRRRLIQLLLVLSALGAPAGVTAQSARDSALVSVLRDARARNWYLRLSADASSYEGRVRRLDHDVVALSNARLAVPAIEAVERRTRQGAGTMKGALIGGAALVIVLSPVALLCERANCFSYNVVLLGGSASVGAVIGGIAGSLIRPGELVWELVWRER